MARTNLPVTVLVRDADNANPGTTAIDATNGMNLVPSKLLTDILIEVTNTFAGAKNVIFRAGVNPPAQRSGLGDLTVSIAQNGVHLFNLETARFAQADGSINIDFDSGTTGTMRAFGTVKA